MRRNVGTSEDFGILARRLVNTRIYKNFKGACCPHVRVGLTSPGYKDSFETPVNHLPVDTALISRRSEYSSSLM